MNRIKELREKTGISQSKFSERYGIPVKTLQAWEADRFQPADYLVSLLAQRIDLENVHVSGWLFTEYRDSRGSGTSKLFPTREKAEKYAHDVWEHMNQRDRESYNEDAGDWFGFAEVEVVWDDEELEYEPVMQDLDLLDTPLSAVGW